ncbi:MAG: VWA domain-containing protein [Cyclobacteriaceae bacterium]
MKPKFAFIPAIIAISLLVHCIEDDPTPLNPVASIITVDQSAEEGTEIKIQIELTEPAGGGQMRLVRGENSTADDSDYSLASSEIEIEPGVRTYSTSLYITDDTEPETYERLVLQLEGDIEPSRNSGLVEFTILDNDAVRLELSVLNDSTHFFEGDTLFLGVSLHNSNGNPVSADIVMLGGDDQLHPLDGTEVLFGGRKDSTLIFRYQIISDGIIENTQEIRFYLENIMNAEPPFSGTEITITDSPLPSISFLSATQTGHEGDSIKIEFELSSLTNEESNITLLVGGSAFDKIDYLLPDPFPTILTFSSTTDSGALNFEVYLKIDGENNEMDNLTFELVDPVNCMIGQNPFHSVQIEPVNCEQFPRVTQNGLFITPVNHSYDYARPYILSFKAQTLDGLDTVAAHDLSTHNGNFSISENGSVSDLDETRFEIIRNDETFVSNTLILLDISGSVIENDEQLNQLKHSVLGMTSTLLNQTDGNATQIAIDVFDGDTEIRTLVELTSDQKLIDSLVKKISTEDVMDGRTNLYGAVRQAVNKAGEWSFTGVPDFPNPLSVSISSVVVFSNGPEKANLTNLNEVLESIEQVEANADKSLDIYSIGYGAADQNVLDLLGRNGNYMPENLNSLSEAFGTVASKIKDDLNSYYFIAYCPYSRNGTSNYLHVNIEDHLGNAASIETCFSADQSSSSCD